jgi:hypothetical protein
MLGISGQTIVRSSVVWSRTKQSYEEPEVEEPAPRTKLETRVAQLEKELLEKATLVVRVTELTQQLRYKETVEVSLRSELLEQRKSCAEKCTACDADVKACGEKVKMWKARVVELGGALDAEEEVRVTI